MPAQQYPTPRRILGPVLGVACDGLVALVVIEVDGELETAVWLPTPEVAGQLRRETRHARELAVAKLRSKLELDEPAGVTA
jgi:hypothetical protein